MDASAKNGLDAEPLSGELDGIVFRRLKTLGSRPCGGRPRVHDGPRLVFITRPLGASALCAAGFLFMLIPARAEDVSAPPQAVAAGFSRLIFDEDFSTFQVRPDGLSYNGKSGVWTNGLGFFSPSPPRLITWDGPGLLTLSSEHGAAGVINTHLRNWPRGSSAGSTVFHFGYFEASMRLVGDHPAPDNWASIWLFSAEHQEKAANPDEWSEIDIFESGFHPAYSAAVHDWHFNGKVFENPEQSPPYHAWARIPRSVDLTQWHTFGALWRPGEVRYYLDNVFVHAAPTQAINDSQPCSLILSVRGNGSSKAQFRWAHVFH